MAVRIRATTPRPDHPGTEAGSVVLRAPAATWYQDGAAGPLLRIPRHPPPAAATGTPAGAGAPRAVLFDRDGTLVEDVPHNTDPARLRPRPHAREALEVLRAAGVRAAVVTNQPDLARGVLTLPQLEALQARMEELLGPVEVTAVCPHLPEAGCGCRKPAPGLVHAACRLLRLAPARTVVVGDIGTDLLAAHRAGAPSLLVPNEATRREETEAARCTAPHLATAVRTLLGGPATRARPAPTASRGAAPADRPGTATGTGGAGTGGAGTEQSTVATGQSSTATSPDGAHKEQDTAATRQGLSATDRTGATTMPNGTTTGQAATTGPGGAATVQDASASSPGGAGTVQGASATGPGGAGVGPSTAAAVRDASTTSPGGAGTGQSTAAAGQGATTSPGGARREQDTAAAGQGGSAGQGGAATARTGTAAEQRGAATVRGVGAGGRGGSATERGGR
ncbi:D-glycero-alpha-D-manno-heptose-1,7-bisphosphate 7-phosphatase [Streptomyces albus]|uniref:D-glycero-alpha-D-manno-heptose-1,7-bisphosphate 7-phosphatase n=1 Tax=Streptomyces albus TaxID=1888 RepID=UPI002867B673|nr:HAD-IIIA family hydrolase [Streptomyces albus]